MRVLLASQEVPPDTAWGGIGTYVAALAPALARLGADVRVLSVVRGQAASDTEVAGYRVHRRDLRRPPGVGRLARLPKTWERVTLAAAVAREARRLDFEPDVVEAPEWNAEGLAVALSSSWPLVVRLHSSAEQLFPFVRRPAVDARLAVALERTAMRRADLLVSTAANLGALAGLSGRVPPARAVALPVPRVETGPSPAPSAAPRITFVGRLERVKAPETIVAAAPQVLARFPAARFTFLGADTGRAPGSYLGHLRALAARLGVQQAIEFAGHRPHDEALDRLRASTLAVFPSRQESFGYGAAEAACLGVPVLASRIPAFAELFADADGRATARLVTVDDVTAWAGAMCELLGDPRAAAGLAATGRAAVSARCAPEEIAASMLGAYEEAIARHRERARRSRSRR
jgi:glycosyltransferase involved in cell wall biosynthesis